MGTAPVVYRESSFAHILALTGMAAKKIHTILLAFGPVLFVTAKCGPNFGAVMGGLFWVSSLKRCILTRIPRFFYPLIRSVQF